MIVLVGLIGVAGIAMALTPLAFDEGASSEEQDDVEGVEVDETDSTVEPATDSVMGTVVSLLEDPSTTDTMTEETKETLEGDVGGSSSGSYTGSAEGDEILGTAGDDSIDGQAGDDIIISDEGNDTLLGGTGDDALHAREGDDVLDGGTGQDSLFGGDGDDTLIGGAGEADVLVGGKGDDQIFVGGADLVYGGHGEDTIFVDGELSDEGVPYLADFERSDDSLVLIVNEGLASEPLSITTSESDPDIREVRLGNTVLALLDEEVELGLEDIVLLVETDGVGLN